MIRSLQTPIRPRTRRTTSVVAATALALLAGIPAQAAEVDFEGFYRARARGFESLSLDRTHANSEGLSAWADHRLWLRPKFLLNDHVTMVTEIRALDNIQWGDQPTTWFDPSAGDDLPLVFTDDLTAPTSDTDPSLGLRDITLWRAWGEVHTGDHRFKVGRMPLHWGAGVWQNDGLGLLGEYGDTADRVQWEGLFGEVYASLAVDVNATGLINQSDGTTSFNGMAAYRTEQVIAGIHLQLRHTSNRAGGGNDLNVFTADLAFDAELGRLDVEVEAVAHFGGGDLDTGINDAQIASGGGIVDAQLDTDAITLGLRAGMATGDGNLTDSRIKTFSFDRDYQVGLILFEQSMPTLAASVASSDNDGRDLGEALTGPTLSNAIFFEPRLSRTLMDGLTAQASFLTARTARLPELDEFEGRRGYGYEFDLSLRYEAFEHLELQATAGVFLPGVYFRNVADTSWDDPVFGGQIVTRIRF